MLRSTPAAQLIILRFAAVLFLHFGLPGAQPVAGFLDKLICSTIRKEAIGLSRKLF
jgi:hypothetical protein